MLIGRGSHARFCLWSNNEAFGNKEFDDAEKCEDERRKAMHLIEHVPRPILPPLVLPWIAKKSIAMVRAHMTLEHAIAHQVLSPDILQRVIYIVMDMLLWLADRRELMMDVHVGNVLLRFASKRYEGVPCVYINDPGFHHDFSSNTLPDHVRRCEFDPRYDLAFFSYSLLGMLRRMAYTPLPITPLSESDLIVYQQYIGAPHHWDMAVGRYAYQPELMLSIDRAAVSHPAKRPRI